jgi:DNA-binding GntR family transcriptional regulator
MRGEYTPGQKLTLRKLAADLGTSMTPVREAVRQLSAFGAVEIIPNKHILVKPLTAEKYLEIVDTRKLLEGHAAARASIKITDQDIKEITRINEKILSFAKKGQLQKAMIENHRFHFAIYKIAGSQTLLEAIECQWLKIGPSLSKYLGENNGLKVNDHSQEFETHTALIFSLKNRNANASLKAMNIILDTATKQLFDALTYQTILSSSTLEEMWPTGGKVK